MLCPLRIRLIGMKPQHRNALRHLSLYAELGQQIIYCQVLPKSTEELTVMLPAGSFDLYTLFLMGRVTYRQGITVVLPGMPGAVLDMSTARVDTVSAELPHERARKQQERGFGDAE